MTDISTEEIIANMRGWTDLTAYFLAAEERWDSVRQNALGANIFNHFVHPTDGSDVTGNGTSTAPFKTVQAAIDAASPLGEVNVRLQDDLHMSRRVAGPRGGRLALIGSKADGTKAVVTFAEEAGNSPGSAPRIDLPAYGVAHVSLSNVHLKLREFSGSVVNREFVSRRGFTGISLLNSTAEALAGCNQTLLGQGGGFGIHMAGGTHIGMAGLWAGGVAAGSDPNAVKECAYSTLGSL
ncbi:hypothetical protein [Pseudaestuariivita sp.]|uniref:hypothetical protein n=1 Tax=Pseudaestuariivita sp. TaxID=2211669 RepID=UPI0040597C5E